MPYATSFAYDSVAIIESLPTGELRTGRDLFETVLAPASVAEPGLVSELYEPRSARDFLGVLHSIRDNAKRYHRSPIVHIETHGGRDGIRLRNDDLLPWSDIAPLLTEINTLSHMNLLVVAAMCHGWHMVSLLRPTDRAPAFGIVGTEEEVDAGELLEAMQRFYRVLVGPKHDFRAAMDEANEGLAYGDWRFKMEGAELWLCRAFREYVRGFTTGETQVQRVNRLVAEVARAQKLDVVATMRARQEISKAMGNNEAWFGYYRTKFLLLDQFPDNAHRFLLRYEDCSDDAA